MPFEGSADSSDGLDVLHVVLEESEVESFLGVDFFLRKLDDEFAEVLLNLIVLVKEGKRVSLGLGVDLLKDLTEDLEVGVDFDGDFLSDLLPLNVEELDEELIVALDQLVLELLDWL